MCVNVITLLLTATFNSGIFSARISLTKLAGVVPVNVTVSSVIVLVPILVTPITTASPIVNGFAATALPLITV